MFIEVLTPLTPEHKMNFNSAFFTAFKKAPPAALEKKA
jgi:hypothetical protein